MTEQVRSVVGLVVCPLLRIGGRWFDLDLGVRVLVGRIQDSDRTESVSSERFELAKECILGVASRLCDISLEPTESRPSFQWDMIE